MTHWDSAMEEVTKVKDLIEQKVMTKIVRQYYNYTLTYP